MSDMLELNFKGAVPKDIDGTADEITRLRAELAAALAECERINKSRNRWGKKYNDCLGKLRLAVMSDSDECKELTAQNNNLRAELAAANTRMSKLDFERTAAELERDALRAENAKLSARAVLIPDSVQKIIDDYPVVCAERDRMREALKPFVVWCEAVEKFSFLKDDAYVCAYDVRLSDLRRARAALEGVTEKEGGKENE